MTPKLRVVSPDRCDESEDSGSTDAATQPLKTSCLINNHNYSEYLCDAVAGALEQDHPFDEIIVVDDGSSDGSLDRLRKRFGKRDRLQIVAKEHGGQLSCIQHAVQIAGGDLIFFLDSDDRQRPKLNREVQAIYQQHPSVDCVSVGYQVFGSGADREHRLLPTRDRGLSTVAAILHRQWVGAPTSCLSMRSSLLEKVLPYPRARAWQTRADDVLVLGSSIVGAHKFHLGKHLIDYQLHGRNHFAGRKWSSAYNMRYSLEVNRLTQWYIEKTGYEISTLARLSPREFRTIEKPRLKELIHYLRMAIHYSLPWDIRIGNLISVAKYYAKEQLRKRHSETVEEMVVEPIASQASESRRAA
jgi:glycosyltransferase involved in cell wall biosynthesis